MKSKVVNTLNYTFTNIKYFILLSAAQSSGLKKLVFGHKKHVHID